MEAEFTDWKANVYGIVHRIIPCNHKKKRR